MGGASCAKAGKDNNNRRGNQGVRNMVAERRCLLLRCALCD
jgi:hypothetical protein